jgi:hypothetical protein
MHARGEHDCFWHTGSVAVFLPQHSLSEIQRFGRLRFVHGFGFHITIPLVSRGLGCRGISVILCSMDKTLAANKSLEDNGGLAGSRVVGSVFMLWGFRAVPQLWRWAHKSYG